MMRPTLQIASFGHGQRIIQALGNGDEHENLPYIRIGSSSRMTEPPFTCSYIDKVRRTVSRQWPNKCLCVHEAAGLPLETVRAQSDFQSLAVKPLKMSLAWMHHPSPQQGWNPVSSWIYLPYFQAICNFCSSWFAAWKKSCLIGSGEARWRLVAIGFLAQWDFFWRGLGGHVFAAGRIWLLLTFRSRSPLLACWVWVIMSDWQDKLQAIHPLRRVDRTKYTDTSMPEFPGAYLIGHTALRCLESPPVVEYRIMVTWAAVQGWFILRFSCPCVESVGTNKELKADLVESWRSQSCIASSSCKNRCQKFDGYIRETKKTQGHSKQGHSRSKIARRKFLVCHWARAC